jgi:hypothetical protein
MKHTERFMKNSKGWLFVLSFALVLLLASCGNQTPKTTPDQNTAISQEEAEAAALKLQSNAGIKAASTENLAALSDQQLTAAWSGLSEREQKAAKMFLDPSGEETGSSSVEIGSSGSTLNAQSADCWYQTWWVYGKNIFGKKLSQFNQRLYWCSNGRIITSSRREVWGETFWIGWRYEGETKRWRYGCTGYTYCRAIVQGHFVLGINGWDPQHYYPRIESTFYP